MPGKDAVLVFGEGGEAVRVSPYCLIRGMEDVRAVAVLLDTRLGVDRAPGIAS